MTHTELDRIHRRQFLGSMATGAAAFAGASAFFSVRGTFAEELVRTPRQTEGPFYPDKLPLDTDNDLLIINDAHHPGRRRGHSPDRPDPRRRGNPLRNALVEIWQVDNNGAYIHTKDPGATSTTRTSRATAGSLPGRAANTTSAPSSRSPTPAGPATSTLRWARAARSCSRPSATSRASPQRTRRHVSRRQRPEGPRGRHHRLQPAARSRASASWPRGVTWSWASRLRPEDVPDRPSGRLSGRMRSGRFVRSVLRPLGARGAATREPGAGLDRGVAANGTRGRHAAAGRRRRDQDQPCQPLEHLPPP